MSTRSSAKNLFPPLDNPKLIIQRRSCTDPTLLNDSEMAAEGNGDLPVSDLQTMEELCQPSLNAQRSESSSSITSSFDTEIAALKAEISEINKNLMRVLQPSLAILKTYMLHEPIKPQVVTTNEFTNFIKANDAILKNIQTNMTSLKNSNLKLKNMFGQFMKMNTASSSGLRTLPCNTITNPKENLKGITTRSGTAYQGPMIPTTSSSFPPVVERETEATKDMVHPTNNGSTEDVRPLVVPTESPILNSQPVISLIIEPVAFPTGRDLIYVFEDELTLRVGKEAITFNLDQTSRYSANYNDITTNRIDVIDMAFEEYSQEVLCFSDVIVSGNPTPYYNPIVFTTSSTLTPFENSDFLLEEVDAFLALEDDPTLPEVDQCYADTKGDILLLEAFLNDDPSLPLPNQENYLPKVRMELKIYDDEFPVIIAKDLSVEEKTALITVLKSHKRVVAWKLSDIKGIDLEFCTHKILMEEDSKPAFQHQRRVNPKIHNVIKNEVLKLLDDGLIYPIYDIPWRCMMAIFHDMIEKTIEVFMDDFLVFGNSFQTRLSHLEKMLKRTVGENYASWSDKLDDALWAFQIDYKTPIGCTKLVYGKACHLPIELEHKAYWALKQANFDLQTASDHRNFNPMNSMNFMIKPMKTLSSTMRKLRGFMTQKSKTVFSTSVIESSSLTQD
nr:reverse transcriptase domain-containing protein [Tanacetum cinerariifolium]